jgi:hypothetical protein
MALLSEKVDGPQHSGCRDWLFGRVLCADGVDYIDLKCFSDFLVAGLLANFVQINVQIKTLFHIRQQFVVLHFCFIVKAKLIVPLCKLVLSVIGRGVLVLPSSVDELRLPPPRTAFPNRFISPSLM